MHRIIIAGFALAATALIGLATAATLTVVSIASPPPDVFRVVVAAIVSLAALAVWSVDHVIKGSVADRLVRKVTADRHFRAPQTGVPQLTAYA